MFTFYLRLYNCTHFCLGPYCLQVHCFVLFSFKLYRLLVRKKFLEARTYSVIALFRERNTIKLSKETEYYTDSLAVHFSGHGFRSSSMCCILIQVRKMFVNIYVPPSLAQVLLRY